MKRFTRAAATGLSVLLRSPLQVLAWQRHALPSSSSRIVSSSSRSVVTVEPSPLLLVRRNARYQPTNAKIPRRFGPWREGMCGQSSLPHCAKRMGREDEDLLRDIKEMPSINEDSATNSSILKALVQPIPLGDINLPSLFPVVLVILTLFLSLPQVLVTALLFALLRTAASQLVLFPETNNDDAFIIDEAFIDDDDDRTNLKLLQWQIDGTTFVLSFFSALLLIPTSWTIVDNRGVGGAERAALEPITIWVGGLVATIVLVWTVGFRPIVQQVVSEEQLSEQDKELNTWDRKFRRQEKDDS